MSSFFLFKNLFKDMNINYNKNYDEFNEYIYKININNEQKNTKFR